MDKKTLARQRIKKHSVYFMCYSIVGWLYEEMLWIIEQHQVVNRGFCLGPWLPIYGFGGLILYFTAYKFAITRSRRKTDILKPVIVFIAVSAGAALLELISTYVIGAAGIDFRTLWSYKDYVINFQERIALLPSLKFGMLGCAIIYFAQDKIRRFTYTKNRYVVLAKHSLCLCFALDVITHIAIGSNYTGAVMFTF